MLEIKKDGYVFDLYPGTVISMEITNTALDDDIVNGSYSFPFKIPLTPWNRSMLNFPDEIAGIVSIQVSVSVEVWVDGLLLFPNATFNLKGTNRTYVNAYLLVGVSTFAAYADSNKLKDKMDYILNFDQSLGDAGDLKLHAKNTLTGSVDTAPYVFPTMVNNDHYQNEMQKSENAYTKDVVYNFYANNSFQLTDQVVVSDQTTEAGLKHGKLTMVPFIYATYILRKILAPLNLTTNVFETDPELKKLILSNNFSLDKWYPIYTQYFINRNNRPIDLKNHVPDMKIGEFLVALKKVFCLYLYKDPFDDKIHFDAFKNLINDPEYVDWTSIALADYSMEETLAKGVKYLPDLADRVLSGTGTMLGVNRKPAVQREVNLPNSGNSIGDVRMVEETGRLYSWQYVFLFSTWLPYTSALGDYYGNPSAYELKNSLPGVVTSKYQFYPSHLYQYPIDYFVPAVGFPGSYQGSDNKEVTSSIISRLLFYRGMKTSSGGHAYPFASSHNYDMAKNRVGNYSLAWDGTDGLYNVWWKDYIRMKDNTKQVSREVMLSLLALLNLNLRKKVRIGDTNFLIRKISLQLPLVKPAKVEFWKIT